MLADAARRAGAVRVTAVIPYFGYARQDHRGTPGEAIAAKTIARLIESAGVDELVVVDPHSPALETMFDVPVHTLTAVPILATALQALGGDDAVVVAPDLGAVKLAERYAAALDLPVAVVRKTRLSGEKVHAVDLVGDVRDRRPADRRRHDHDGRHGRSRRARVCSIADAGPSSSSPRPMGCSSARPGPASRRCRSGTCSSPTPCRRPRTTFHSRLSASPACSPTR